jgi:hypothetical protein
MEEFMHRLFEMTRDSGELHGKYFARGLVCSTNRYHFSRNPWPSRAISGSAAI